MKKILLSTMVFIISLSLFAESAVYNSNAISQKLGAADGSTEYKLEVVTDNNEVTTFLYLNDEVIKKTITSEMGSLKKILVEEGDNKTEEVYNNSLLIRKSSGNKQTVYTYDGDRLITKVEKEDDEVLSFSRYYYSDNSLISILQEIDGEFEYYVFKDNDENKELLISDDETYTRISAYHTLLTSTKYEGDITLSFNDANINDDGSLVIETFKDGYNYKEYYNPSGSLYRTQESDDDGNIISTVDFELDNDNNILKQVETKSEIINNKETDIVITTYYKNSKEDSIEVAYDGTLQSKTFFDDSDRKNEILYKNGRKYCTIIYSFDGKTILDVEYEKR
jgi:hypothetical protein